MSKLKKIIEPLLIVPRGLFWLFFGRGRRKLSKIWWTYKFGGLKLCWELAVTKFSNAHSTYDYNRNQLTGKQSHFLIKRFKEKPLISIITPVYKIDAKTLSKCIKSVSVQHYKNWELILVDDASESDTIKHVMNHWASRDKRIKVHYLNQNSGIAAATNYGIKNAKGDFIGFLDHDDELTLDALTWMVWAMNKNPQALWFYSDEDLITVSDKCHDPHFKPDYSPELLLSIMFTCHFSVYSAKIIAQVKGLRLGFDGAQDHDLALRISEIVTQDKVVHIPRVLYHWREVPSSTTMGIEKKEKAPLAGQQAVRDALERRNLKGIVTSNRVCKTLYMIELQPIRYPEVTVIIPAKNFPNLMKKCLDSIRRNTKYPNYNILVIDNQSDDKEFLEYIRKQESKDALRIIRYDKPFNHSDMNNLAVHSVTSELVVIMNNDIEIITDNWLEQLVATVSIDNTIACVGCLLLYNDKKVQHGGVILGVGDRAGHAHKHIPSETIGYYGRLYALQQMSGVTAAFMIAKKSAFEKIGGFRADRYPTSYNDVDLCIRFYKEGFRCLYNPMVKAYHYESKTRPVERNEIEFQKRIKSDYSDIFYSDPFYNPNLSLDNEQFRGFRPFPVKDQIVEFKDLENKD
jgi:O-antigen biosynthesis protein